MIDVGMAEKFIQKSDFGANINLVIRTVGFVLLRPFLKLVQD
jgi:hypothetical protein